MVVQGGGIKLKEDLRLARGVFHWSVSPTPPYIAGKRWRVVGQDDGTKLEQGLRLVRGVLHWSASPTLLYRGETRDVRAPFPAAAARRAYLM